MSIIKKCLSTNRDMNYHFYILSLLEERLGMYGTNAQQIAIAKLIAIKRIRLPK